MSEPFGGPGSVTRINALNLMYALHDFERAKGLQERADANFEVVCRIADLEISLDELKESMLIGNDVEQTKQRTLENRKKYARLGGGS